MKWLFSTALALSVLMASAEVKESTNERSTALRQYTAHVTDFISPAPLSRLTNGAATVVRIWRDVLMHPMWELHQFTSSNQGTVTWDYYLLLGTNRTHVALPQRATHTWQDIKDLGVLDLPDQGGLPDHGLPEVQDGVRYTVSVSTRSDTRYYSYSNPDAYPRDEDRSMARIARLIHDPTELEQKWQQDRLKAEALADRQREDQLNSMVGRAFTSLSTTELGVLVDARVARREGNEYIIQHRAGVARVPYEEILEQDESEDRSNHSVDRYGSTAPGGG